MLAKPSVALLAVIGTTDAFWRMSCSVIQTGRIDPIVSPGKVASHAHKISGASNIGLSSTFDELQTSNCSSCEIQADKSAYWTPLLYYQHSNGSFEEVVAPGMAVYYLGRGDTTSEIKPFPPGFRMLSGDALARYYNTSAMTYKNTRPIADRVSFACLDTAPKAETPGMSDTTCKNGLRAQVHFQSCWNGKDLYKSDNSHVAYMSGIDNGECPPEYPVHFMHIFFEVLYSVANIKQDGGKFVFANGDPTGFGFHGDFLNGWDNTILTSAITSCGANNGDPSGVVKSCPAFTSDIENFAQTCAQQPPLINEPTTGMIPKLPGCITITDGPEEATEADIVCGAGVAQPSLNQAVVGAKDSGAVAAVPATGSAPDGNTSAGSNSTGSTNTTSSEPVNEKVAIPVPPISVLPFSSTSASSAPFPSTNKTPTTTNFSSTLVTSAVNPTSSTTASVLWGANGYVIAGCYAELTDGARALNGSHYTDTTTMSVEACTTFCEKGGFPIAGVEDAQECYCGATNTASKTAATACNMPCTGNAKELCGGPAALNVYMSG